MTTRSLTAGVAPLASRLALVGFTAGLLIGGAIGCFVGSLVGAMLGGAMSRIERAGPLGAFLLSGVCIVSTLFASQATAWQLPQPMTPVAIFLLPIAGLLGATLLARRARPGTPVHETFARAGWSAIAMSAAILASLRPEAVGAPLVSDAAVVVLACVAALDGTALARVWRGHVEDYGIGNDLRTRSVQSPDGGPYRVPPARDELVGNRRQALRMVGAVISIDAILLAVSLVLRFRVGP